MTRLAIAADLHVDDFGARLAGSGWNARFEDAIEAVRFIGRTARERGTEALIVAGDYTESRSPAPPRVARILEALQDGPGRQIHVRGNHDSERSGRSIVDVLGTHDGWDGFTQPGITLVEDIAVCVIPWIGRSYLRTVEGMESAPAAEIWRILGEQYMTIARGLFARARELHPDATPILVGHQQLSGGRMNDSQAAFLGDHDLVVDARALASIGFAAAIFGHIHRAQTVIDDPACPVLFVGSAHRVDFAEADEQKSFVVVDVAAGKASIERIPIPARRFVTLQAPRPDDAFNVSEAIVRAIDVEPDVDVAELRRVLEADGAFEVQEIRIRSVSPEVVAGGMAEDLAPAAALEQYFAEDDDREALVERGRGILAEVVA